MLPSRQAYDLIAGHQALPDRLGVIAGALVWDIESRGRVIEASSVAVELRVVPRHSRR